MPATQRPSPSPSAPASSPAPAAAAAPAAGVTPPNAPPAWREFPTVQNVTDVSITVTVPTANSAVRCPAYPIRPGWRVRVGPIPNNIGQIGVARTGQNALTPDAPRWAFNATSIPVEVYVSNLNELWVGVGNNANDGAQFQIIKG